jgi:hypothetical protein
MIFEHYCYRMLSEYENRQISLNPTDHKSVRPSSDTEFASNLWKCVVTRSGFCRWCRVAEYEKQRRFLSLNRWNIDLENEPLPVDFGQGQLSLPRCIHIHLFFLCCLYNLPIKFRLLPKPSGTLKRSLDSWTTLPPTNLRVMALGTSRTPHSWVQ